MSKSTKITVFGSSKPVPGQEAYKQAFQLGDMIGEAGYSVLTGGYMGTMEAVSQGCAAAGGHVIGVTCEEIEQWRPIGANPWVQEEIRCPTLRERLAVLIDQCDAAIALPGGAGTFAEIALMWNQLQTQSISLRPLILVGKQWKTVLQTLEVEAGAYITTQHMELLTFANDVKEAWKLAKTQLGNV